MKKILAIEDVYGERVRIAFPNGLTVQQALEAGVLIGGAEFVANAELRVLAKDRLDEYGVECLAIARRRDAHSGLQNRRAG